MALEKQLQTIVGQECDAAQAQGDHKKIWRTAKIFSSLNLPYEGLVRYCNSVRMVLREEIRRHSLTLDTQPSGAVIPYLDMVTGVLDRTMVLTDQHRTSVDRAFGPGAHLRLLQVVQIECDALLVPTLQRFVTDRHFASMSKDVRARTRSVREMLAQGGSNPPPESLDPRTIDRLLEEVAFITREAELFDRDLRSMAKEATDKLKAAPTKDGDEGAALRKQQLLDSMGKDTLGATLSHVSKLNEIVQELTGHLIAFEEYCMIENVHKAISMNEPVPLDAEAPSGAPVGASRAPKSSASSGPVYAPTTSMVDDVFYILKKSADRAFATCNVNAGCAVLNHVNSILTRNYKQALELSIRAALGGQDTSSSSGGGYSLFSPSGGAGAGASSARPRVTLPLVLNNLSVSVRYTVQLKEQLQLTFDELFGQRVEEQQMLRHCLDDVAASANLLKRIVDDFFHKVATAGGIGGGAAGTIVATRVRKALEAWTLLSYDISEAAYTQHTQAVASGRVGGVVAPLEGDEDEDDGDNDGAEGGAEGGLQLSSSDAVVRVIMGGVHRVVFPLQVLHQCSLIVRGGVEPNINV